MLSYKGSHNSIRATELQLKRTIISLLEPGRLVADSQMLPFECPQKEFGSKICADTPTGDSRYQVAGCKVRQSSCLADACLRLQEFQKLQLVNRSDSIAFAAQLTIRPG